ncbi:N-acetylmuramoyl-L-alanine amidase [Neobacillus drentensis]|uniref:peptidoglycan recognition protein family protein n=1 Tax=Neobacillus drentensis TaxID=220684 RepID=UPI002FFE5318
MSDKVITVDELLKLLKGRKYKYSQVHHTYQPDHADFDGKNHLSLQQGMRNYHMNDRGWYDIGQHVTLMPDGLFVTGRDFEDDKIDFDDTPAGIAGYNTGAFMVEMLGNFDKGKDRLTGKQLDSMVKLQHYLVSECGAKVMFHREHAPKTCPGTGIDKDEFMKLVNNYGKDDKKDEPKKSYPYPGKLIREGARGSNAALVQNKVGAKSDGIFGPKTKIKVKEWQTVHGLVPDGIVGPKTWKKMF